MKKKIGGLFIIFWGELNKKKILDLIFERFGIFLYLKFLKFRIIISFCNLGYI